MYKKELNTGDKFGSWTVIEQMPERKNGYIIYRVRCACGVEGLHSGSYLRTQLSEYCRSCSAKKRIPKGKDNKFYRHGACIKGDEKRPTNKVWVVMKQRCYNQNSKDYKNYGHRGIKVCEKWQTFEGFFEDMGICPPKLSLDRIDNNGDYCKENCKWVTRKEQNNNKRSNTFFIINEIRVTRTQIQDKLKWTRDMYRRRFEKYGEEWICQQYLNYN